MQKSFLKKMKGVKNLIIEMHFSDKVTFFLSAKHKVKNNASSVLTEQETYRLKKHLIQV